MDILNRRTLQTFGILALAFIMTSCASTGYQPLPPVKVITETVEVEIYAPPLPKEIQLNDVVSHFDTTCAWNSLKNFTQS